jgi:hypothetical protein
MVGARIAAGVRSPVWARGQRQGRGCQLGPEDSGGGCNTLCYGFANYLLITFISSLITHQNPWLLKF